MGAKFRLMSEANSEAQRPERLGSRLFYLTLADWIYLLLAAFFSLQLISFAFWSDKADVLAPEAISAQHLSTQLIVFLCAFLLLLWRKLKRPGLALWPLTSLLVGIYLTLISIFAGQLVFSWVSLLLNLTGAWSSFQFFSQNKQEKQFLYKWNLPLASLILLFTSLLNLIYLVVLLIQGQETQLAADMSYWFLSLLLMGILVCCLLLIQGLRELRPGSFKRLNQPLSERAQKLISLAVIGISLFISLFLMGRYLVYRVWTFSTPTYDFGLFNQMFSYMARSGQPLTTLERDGLVSHFAVHFAPLFYVFLPFYKLLPTPECLQILQLLTVASGAIPLWLILRDLKLSQVEQALFTALYLLQPGILLASSYDLHENCFYAPLSLWLLYCLLKGKIAWSFLPASLLLLVKEDAALYVVSAAIWLFFWRGRETDADHPRQLRRHRLWALALAAEAVIAFVLIANFLNSQGYGVMSYRFAALDQYGIGGFSGILRSCFQNPANILGVMFGESKFSYLASLSLTLGLLALSQVNNRHYLLFLPLLVMNLATTYPYQYRLDFQYGYGSHAFLIVAALLAYVGIRQPEMESTKFGLSTQIKWQRALATGLLVFQLLAACTVSVNYLLEADYLRQSYLEEPERYQSIARTLGELPRDKVIASNPFLTTHLADCLELYDLEHSESLTKGREADILVFYKEEQTKTEKEVIDYYRQKGYRSAPEYANPYLEVLIRPRTGNQLY